MVLNDSHLLMKSLIKQLIEKIVVFWQFRTFYDVQSNLIFLCAYLQNTHTTNFSYSSECDIIDISTSRNLNKWTCHRQYEHLLPVLTIFAFMLVSSVFAAMKYVYYIHLHLHLMESLSSREGWDMMLLEKADEKSSKVIFSHGIWRVV